MCSFLMGAMSWGIGPMENFKTFGESDDPDKIRIRSNQIQTPPLFGEFPRSR